MMKSQKLEDRVIANRDSSLSILLCIEAEDHECYSKQVFEDWWGRNPIGELQELCQHQQISMPVYEFEELSEGFRCAVQAMGL